MSITAKDKLRKQLGKGLDVSKGHVSFSSEYASRCTLADNGIENVLEFVGMPQPDMYSMELSLFVLEAGVKLLAAAAPRPAVPVADRLGAAQVVARGVRGAAFLPARSTTASAGWPRSMPRWR